MASFRVLGDKVVSKAEYLEDVRAYPDRPSPLEGGFSSMEEAPQTDGVTQFQPIGLGLPLTILLREVYTGRHPKKGVLGQSKAMLVTSALKGYASYAPASRAVNFSEPSIKPHTALMAPSAANAGTNVVAYSPAVLTEQMFFTVEMAFDRYPEGLLNTIASAFTGAANIPLLLPAREFLLAAGGLIKIGNEWAEALVDGRASFTQTDTIDFDVPGVESTKAAFHVMGSEDHEGLTYKPGQGLVSDTGVRYDGDQPYVVLSLDGAERKSLEQFAPTLATAEQLKKFLNARDGTEASVEFLLEGLKLANDITYRKEAQGLAKQLETEPDGPVKEAKTKRLNAVKKNILTDDLKLT